jgi:short-subunit dehydrogenase
LVQSSRRGKMAPYLTDPLWVYLYPPSSGWNALKRNGSISGQKRKVLIGLGLAAGLWAGLSTVRRLAAPGQPSTSLETNGSSRTALITGASSGIGAAFARQLATMGYDLILVARREERLAALATELGERHPIRAEVLAADLANSADVERVENRITELENLDLLINNAGFGAPGSFAEAELVTQLNMIDVHVVASMRLTRAALPGMIARRRGAIINVSSIAGMVPIPGSTTYSSTKAYLNVFSAALQAELRGTGVKVQALCPGFTHTEFHDTPTHRGFHRSRIPEAMWMSAEEVAEQSLRALRRNQVIFIPSFRNRLMAAVARSVPTSLLHVLRGKATK